MAMSIRSVAHDFALWPGDWVVPLGHDPKEHDDIYGLVIQAELTVRSASGATVERAFVQWHEADGSVGKTEWHESWTLVRTGATAANCGNTTAEAAEGDE